MCEFNRIAEWTIENEHNQEDESKPVSGSNTISDFSMKR